MSWSTRLKKDMKSLNLQIEMVENINEWRKSIETDIMVHVANPNLLGLRL